MDDVDSGASRLIRVTDQAYERVEKVVANMRKRGLSVSMKSVTSEVLMLMPIEEVEPQPVEKKRRTRKPDQAVASAL